jgi:enoyl-CoA hydratase
MSFGGFECFNVTLDEATGVLHVQLSRATSLNAMTRTFFSEIAQVFGSASADQRVRCVLLSAAGRMFSCGLDLKDAAASLTGQAETESDTDSSAREHGQLWKAVTHMQTGFWAVERCAKPVLSAIHGACLGGALELILATDVRFCSADAVFAVRETKVAIVADLGMLHRIVRQCGRAWANLLALTGADINAADACRAGIVSHVFPTQQELMARAHETAIAIAANSPLTVQGVKHVMSYSSEHTPEDSLKYVALWNQAFLRSPDLTEAMMAFFEKRKPQFNARL